MNNKISATLIFISLLLNSSLSSSSTIMHSLQTGSSLHVERSDILASPDGNFAAGFHQVGDNAFSFAIWFNQTGTVVWMANRDQPVNGKRSKLSLLHSGDVVLADAGLITVWRTNTISASKLSLYLTDAGNLVLRGTTNASLSLWESFHFPTNTLLPDQLFTKDTVLISSKSRTNHSSGFHKLFFDNDNVLKLAFNGPNVSTFYWPDPDVLSWQVGRTTYNDTKVAFFDNLGNFQSSDQFSFRSADYGNLFPRRLTLDHDGNLRLYSLSLDTMTLKWEWAVSWQVFSQSCKIRGICGPYSQCIQDPYSGSLCSCLPGFSTNNPTDWVYGCKPEFDYLNNLTMTTDVDFLELPHAESKGYDSAFHQGITLEACKNICAVDSSCKAINYFYDPTTQSPDPSAAYNCYPKNRLFNGYRTFDSLGMLYVKLPRYILSDPNHQLQRMRGSEMSCSAAAQESLNRTYVMKNQDGSLRILLWVAGTLGVLEVITIVLVFLFLYFRKYKNETDNAENGYTLTSSGFKRFTYNELKRATRGFADEIGRGGSGVVYRGTLSDQRVAAIKKLNQQANQGGEAEFLAEVTTLGKLNHMNLIEMWGYCAEGKHRLLVYEYMEGGSLAQSLDSKASSAALDWKSRHQIALGTAKGLAYLHEECLEWILHCDIKPQNILLDSHFQPKVADFGLSKLLNRDVNDDIVNKFSQIRGTRGYMAPEWVMNQPITSKVDVYSYGIVVLEMISENLPEFEAKHLKEMVSGMKEAKGQGNNSANASWLIERLTDPLMGNSSDMNKMKTLIEVALQCVEENKDARPTMRHVVEMLELSQP